VLHDGTNTGDNFSPGIILYDVGNDGDSSQISSKEPIIIARRQFATLYGKNVKWDQANRGWRKSLNSYSAVAFELGDEGASWHFWGASDTAIWAKKNMTIQFRHNSVDGGDGTINYPAIGTTFAQFKCPIYIQMDSVNENTHWQNNTMPGLWVRGSLYDHKLAWFDQISSDNKGGAMYFRKMRGTVAGGKTAIVDRDTIFRFVFQAKDSVLSVNNDYLRTGAMIAVINDSNFTNTTSMPMRIDFMTAPTGTVVPFRQFSVRSNSVNVYSSNFYSRGMKPINNDTYSLGGSGASWWSGYFGEGGLNINGSFYVNVTGFSQALTVRGTTGNMGLGTGTPLHKLSVISNTAKNLNAFNFTDSDINIIRTTVAQATDTSSIHAKFSSLGSPTFNIIGKAGDALSKVDSTGTTTTNQTITGTFTGSALTRGTDAFTTTAETDTVTISGASVNDFYTITLTGTAAPSANDAIRLEATATGFVLHRAASGTSGLTYVWKREK
jgi:hypothetical protein